MSATDSRWSEKLAAAGVASAMNAKVKFGMGGGGGGDESVTTMENSGGIRFKVVRKSLDVIQRGIKTTNNFLKSLELLKEQIENTSQTKKRKSSTTAVRKPRRIKEKKDTENEESSVKKEISRSSSSSLAPPQLPIVQSRKRKLMNDDGDDNSAVLGKMKRKIIRLPRKRKVDNTHDNSIEIPSKLLKINESTTVTPLVLPSTNNKRKHVDDDDAIAEV